MSRTTGRDSIRIQTLTDNAKAGDDLSTPAFCHALSFALPKEIVERIASGVYFGYHFI